MPIPQFHRTPKTRRRRPRRSSFAGPGPDAHDESAAITPPQTLPADVRSETGGSMASAATANQDASPEQEEVAALLSCWPRRRKSS